MCWFEEFWKGTLSSGITLLKVSQTDEKQPTEETQKLISIPILDHRMSSLLTRTSMLSTMSTGSQIHFAHTHNIDSRKYKS